MRTSPEKKTMYVMSYFCQEHLDSVSWKFFRSLLQTFVISYSPETVTYTDLDRLSFHVDRFSKATCLQEEKMPMSMMKAS